MVWKDFFSSPKLLPPFKRSWTPRMPQNHFSKSRVFLFVELGLPRSTDCTIESALPTPHGLASPTAKTFMPPNFTSNLHALAARHGAFRTSVCAGHCSEIVHETSCFLGTRSRSDSPRLAPPDEAALFVLPPQTLNPKAYKP